MTEEDERSPWPLLLAVAFITMVASCESGWHTNEIAALEKRVTALEAAR